jgi:hypothetical protein
MKIKEEDLPKNTQIHSDLMAFAKFILSTK